MFPVMLSAAIFREAKYCGVEASLLEPNCKKYRSSIAGAAVRLHPRRLYCHGRAAPPDAQIELQQAYTATPNAYSPGEERRFSAA